MRLGLTGGYCAGKNAAAALLAARGWDCVDVDALGHEAMELARDRIVERFGPGILGPEGSLDRRALARVVFSDPRALADQEAIVHPVAIELLEARVAEAEGRARAAGEEPLVCVNAALLHRVPHLAGCAVVIEVRAPLALRFARALARDRAGPAAAIRRLWRQRRFRAAFLAEARASG
ncbi:MAG: dephospho-CoA kinase, partial [Spirochaetaceae bacterium]|nr:dephospho-CoA kinase [Spirochaetaceae bacterium]